MNEHDASSTATETLLRQQTPTEQLIADLRRQLEELIADLDEMKTTVDRIASILGTYQH